MNTPLLRVVVRVLFLPALVIAVAALVKGYALPGGGFAAGTIAGVALLLERMVFGEALTHRLAATSSRSGLIAAGLGVVLAVAVVPMLAGLPFLQHLPEPGAHVVHLGALELHTALVFDLGVFLVVLGFVMTAVALIAPAGERAAREEAEAGGRPRPEPER